MSALFDYILDQMLWNSINNHKTNILISSLNKQKYKSIKLIESLFIYEYLFYDIRIFI